MSEISKDVGRAADHVRELARSVGAEVDKGYAAAKDFDWGGIAAIAGAAFVICVAICLVQMIIEANRTQPKA